MTPLETAFLEVAAVAACCVAAASLIMATGWLIETAKARKHARRLPPPPPPQVAQDLPDPSKIPDSWLEETYTSPAYRTDRGAEETSRYDIPDDWTDVQ
jgi:hypothetical protein